MSEYDLVVRAPRAITPTGEVGVQVGVRNGMIATVQPFGSDLTGAETFALAPDEVLLPGLVDTHVHVNEPGRTHWEGFASATRAAAAGGVTTIVDMPLNSVPPTNDVAALKVKRRRAGASAFVDVGFWGGAVPTNVAQLERLHRAGVFGFKSFLSDPGVPEFAPLDAAGLEKVLEVLAGLGAMLLVHAEDPGVLEAAPPAAGPDYAGFLNSRPARAERTAITTVIGVAARTGARVHILHLSDAGALPLIAQARARGVQITAETCPHYLTLVADQVPAGATAFKCSPPIREATNQDALWQGLREGLIDIVVTDHSPATAELKNTGDFATGWGGISSLQLGLSATWTAARTRGLGLPEVVGWMATAPAALLGLGSKGTIEPGRDADLVVFAPRETFVVDATGLHHKNPITAYDGHELTGVVRSTWLRGQRVEEIPQGRLLQRGEA